MPYDIIDAHCHYWEPDRPDRPWDRSGFDTGPAHSAEQLLADAANAGVTRIVQVTPSIMGSDNTYSREGARRYPDRVVGVFGRFYPVGHDFEQRLALMCEQREIVGIRLTLNKPPWDSWLLDNTLEPFWNAAAQAGMPVAITAADRAAQLYDVAQRYPDLVLLVDHMALHHNQWDATARDSADPFANWSQVLRLSQLPNVRIKVSCFPELSHEDYPFPDIHRYFKDLYDHFGAERLIWGSNYPASRHRCSYRQSVDYASKGLLFLSEDDKAHIFGKTLLKSIASRLKV
jgi:predicted TIM-barrel fold metal-dependent hydrolase